MEQSIDNITEWLRQIFSNSHTVIFGILGNFLGFFLPIKDPVNLLVAFFIIDSAIGYLKNRKLYRQKFSKRKIFETTVPRMIAVVLFMMLLFSLDTTFDQSVANTPFIIGYFIGGVLIFNIGKNLYHLTKWSAFLDLIRLLERNAAEKSGIHSKKKEDENESKN